MHHRQYPPYPQYNSQYDPQYSSQNSPQYHFQYSAQYSPRYHSHYEPQYSTQNIPQYSSQCDPQSRPQYSPQYNSQFSPQHSPQNILQYSPQYSPDYSSQLPEKSLHSQPQEELSTIQNTEYLDEEQFQMALDELRNEWLEKLGESSFMSQEDFLSQMKLHQILELISLLRERKSENGKHEEESPSYIPQHNSQYSPPFPTTELSPICSTSNHSTVPNVKKRKQRNRKQGKERKPSAFKLKQIVECQIPSPPIEQITLLKTAPVQKIEKVQIPSPLVQKVIPLKVAPKRTALQVHFKMLKIPIKKMLAFSPHQITEVPIVSPPIQPIVSLKTHIPHKVTEIKIPLPPIQKVISLKPFPVQRIVTTSVPSQETPIQQIIKLQVAPVHKVVEVSVPSQNTPIQQVMSLQITPPPSTQVEPEVPSWKSTVKSWFKSFANSLFKSPVTGSAVESSVEISETSEKTKLTPQTKQQFSGTCIIKSRQLHPKILSTYKTKAISLSMKPQFSGSCMNKSHQLHSKNRLCGTGWKKRREKRVPHHRFMKESLHKSHRSKKRSLRKNRRKSVCVPSWKSPNLKPLLSDEESSLFSWKFRKKKPVCSRSSPLNEIASWKRRKKKTSIVTKPKFMHVRKGLSSRKSLAWKRRMKRQHPWKWLFFMFDWKPGIASPFKSLENKLLFRPGMCERVQDFKMIDCLNVKFITTSLNIMHYKMSCQ